MNKNVLRYCSLPVWLSFLFITLITLVIVVDRWTTNTTGSFETFESDQYTTDSSSTNIVSRVNDLMNELQDGVFYDEDNDDDDVDSNKKLMIFKGKVLDFKGDTNIFQSRVKFGDNNTNDDNQGNDDITFTNSSSFENNIVVFSDKSSIELDQQNNVDPATPVAEQNHAPINSRSVSSMKTNVEYLQRLMPDEDYDITWDDQRSMYKVTKKIPTLECTFDDKDGKNKNGCITSMWSAVINASSALNNQVCSCCCNKYLQKKNSKMFTYIRLLGVPSTNSTIEIPSGGEHYVDLRGPNAELRSLVLRQTDEKLNSKLSYVYKNGSIVPSNIPFSSSTDTIVSELKNNVDDIGGKALYIFHHYPGCHNNECKNKVMWLENNKMQKKDYDDFMNEGNKSKFQVKFVPTSTRGQFHIQSVKNPHQYLLVKNNGNVGYSSTKTTWVVRFMQGSDGYLNGQFVMGMRMGNGSVLYIYLEPVRDRSNILLTTNVNTPNITFRYQTLNHTWSDDLVIRRLKVNSDLVEIPLDDE